MASTTLLIISRIWHFCQVFWGKTFKKVCLVQCIKFNNLEQTEDLPKTLLHGRKTFSISVRHRRLSFLTHISFNDNFKFFWSHRVTSIFIKKWYPMLLNLDSSDQWEFGEKYIGQQFHFSSIAIVWTARQSVKYNQKLGNLIYTCWKYCKITY